MARFAKYNYKGGGYAIVQPLEPDDLEVIRKNDGSVPFESEDSYWARFIYGSKRKYEDSGNIFCFFNVESIDELDDEYVLTEHFTGLL